MDDGIAINPDFALQGLVNRSFTFPMIALLPFLLAAAPLAGDSAVVKRPVAQMASATVTIIQAEPITFALGETKAQKPDRQVRQREEKPLVEFY